MVNIESSKLNLQNPRSSHNMPPSHDLIFYASVSSIKIESSHPRLSSSSTACRNKQPYLQVLKLSATSHPPPASIHNIFRITLQVLPCYPD
ncbi:unnamed protein product [Lactuca virosa]|uniref:Uncharacterized protein n=1 Tax=Lactuca virosa TaxID=75947 RepID=A0AAU9P4B1_9ASTR|nr:unnamed protein product [Lactuca virosa]